MRDTTFSFSNKRLGKNTHDTRIENAGVIIQLLSKYGAMSRAELSKRTGLTPASITYIVRNLIDRGIIFEGESVESNSKRPALGIHLNNRISTIALTIDRTVSYAAVVSLDGTTSDEQCLTYSSDRDIKDTIKDLQKAVRNLIEKYSDEKEICGIGIAIPGPYITKSKKIELVSGTFGWNEIDFEKAFSSFGLPCVIEQNANCAALYEVWYNKGTGEDNFLYVLHGHGIGAGIINNGLLLDGFLGTAGEIGHVSVDMNGEICECGNRGCLELYSSLNAIERNYYKRTGLEKSGAEVINLSLTEDRDAKEIIEIATNALSVVLASVSNVLNEETIIISGETENYEDVMVPKIAEKTKKLLLPRIAERMTIRGSKSSHFPTLIGVSARVFCDEVISKNQSFV